MSSFLKISLIFFAFSFATLSSYGAKASKEEKKLYKKAKKALSKEQYLDAKENYSKLVELVPTNDIYNFEAGLSYYFSDFERNKSISYFEAALANSKEDTIPELKYYLGRAYHLNSDFEKSKTTLNEFIPFIKSHKAGQELLKETNHRIHLNDNGIKFNAESNNNIKIKNLGANINSSEREYAPV
ncbi:MAG: hypothetical protein JKY30_02685 [Flavobacteriales bacterium]|nr:hypothetical protein [Flavobacteriales bacterium]